MKRRILCILVVVLLFVVSAPFKVEAASNYHYLDEKGAKQSIAQSSVNMVTASSQRLKDGWFIVQGNVTITGRSLEVEGKVNLILADKAKLTVPDADGDKASIQYRGKNTQLTVYAQSTGSAKGQLHTGGGDLSCGGIGHGFWVHYYHEHPADLTINGGKIVAQGGRGYPALSAEFGTLTINGGEVEATNDDGVAIGYSGRSDSTPRPSWGRIIINGGKVKATGKSAGIGGNIADYQVGSITINGGTVEAEGTYNSPGIGASTAHAGAQITINGGKVTAKGGDGPTGSAAIGGADLIKVTITGGTVKATGATSYFRPERAIGPTSGQVEGNVKIRPGAGKEIKVYKGAKEADKVLWKTIPYPSLEAYNEEDTYFESVDHFTPSFSDVKPNDWFYTYVEALAAKGIVGGYKDSDKFGPRDELTREQAAKMTAEAAGLNYEGKVATFADVAKTSWATGYIAALVESGAVSGYKGTNNFGPKDNIKRSHVSKVVALAFKLKMGNMPVNLSDLPSDPVLKDAIMKLASNGIVKGYQGTDKFRPNNEITRAEFSKIILITMAVSSVEKAESTKTPAACEKAQAAINDLPVDQDMETRVYLQARLDAIKPAP